MASAFHNPAPQHISIRWLIDLMYRLSYRNFGDHESLVINHSVTSGTGVGIRWYELRNAAGQTLGSAAPVLFQQGTFAPTNDFRWMGSAAMDKTGGIAIGYNISSSSDRAEYSLCVSWPVGSGWERMGNETSVAGRKRIANRQPDTMGRLQHHQRRPGGWLHDGLHDAVPTG